jgi:hypothetical protein
MAHIEQAIRTMLRTATALSEIADENFTYAYRPQLSAGVFPAVTYTVTQRENATLGGTLQKVTVEASLVHETLDLASEKAAELRDCFAPGTHNSFVIEACVLQSSALEEPILSDGDEQQPAVYTCTYEIYYREP